MKYGLYAAAIWCTLLGLYTFLLCGADKLAAKRGQRRVPEKRFFFFCFLGGAFGLALGMLCFRHKTLHLSFILAATAGMVLWGATLFFLTALCFR